MTAEQALLATFAQEHPIDVAQWLDNGTAEEVAHVLSQLEAGDAGRVVARMAPAVAAASLSALSLAEAAEILAEAGPSAAALILARSSEARRRATLGAMSGRRADAIRRLLMYAAHTAGSVMDALALCVAADATVQEALGQVKTELAHALSYVYIVDREQRLVGVITLAQLLQAEPEASVVAVMRERPQAIAAHASLTAVIAHPGWRHYHAMPVVARDGVLLGAIRYDTVRAIERELGQSVRRTNVAQTAGALAQLYAIGTLGMAEWLTGLSSARRNNKSQVPP